MAMKKRGMTKAKTADVQQQLPEVGPPAWVSTMNPEQLEAIMHQGGPTRLLASPGAGKTRVITHRMARMVADGVDPDRILALTFSKKAADEMNARAVKLGVHARVGTWHSLCLQILRQDQTRFATWTIQGEDRIGMKNIVGWKEMNWKGADVSALLSFIGLCKAHLEAPGSPECMQRAERVFGSHTAIQAVEAFSRYNDRLETREILTFDDYLVRVYEHFQDEENRTRWASRWDYLLGDEHQDSSPAQTKIAEMLARDHRNYMVVADFFQAIYKFRGAEPESLIRFEAEWPGCKTYWLPTNYRSGKRICAAANGVISQSRVEGIEPRKMVPARADEGTVEVRAHEDLDDEAKSFAGWVKSGVANDGATYADFCALFRTNAQSRALEEGLIAERIPYVVVGGVSFYERKEVKDLLAYLRLGNDEGDLDDVKRCINAPFRFLGAKFVERVVQRVDESRAEGDAVWWGDIARDVADRERVQFRQKDSAKEWASLIESISKRIAAGTKTGPSDIERSEARPTVILDDLVKRTGYLAWLTKEEGEETLESSAASNVRELIRLAERFATVGDLTAYIDATIRAARNQREDAQAGGERVLLMSGHRAKGLEFKRVWIAGFNEMIFPHVKGDLEEERRLAYVAITRAKDHLVISHVRTLAMRSGIRDAAPSRFIGDVMEGLAKEGFGLTFTHGLNEELENDLIDEVMGAEPAEHAADMAGQE